MTAFEVKAACMGVLISRELSILKLVELGILNRTIGVEMANFVVLSNLPQIFSTPMGIE